MKRRMLTFTAALALLLVASAFAGASTEAAGKPGFVPGKWTGIGTISGSQSDGSIGTKNRGQVRFTLVVSPDRTVTGAGTWKRTQTGAGFDTKSVLVGTASLKFSGPSRDASFVGQESARGTITAGGVTRPLGMPPTKLEGTLVVTRAGDCTANGTATIPTRPGLKLQWTAKRAIAGTCNA
jgi:hypothetical protein